jgi:hypothetical protein
MRISQAQLIGGNPKTGNAQRWINRVFHGCEESWCLRALRICNEGFAAEDYSWVQISAIFLADDGRVDNLEFVVRR